MSQNSSGGRRRLTLSAAVYSFVLASLVVVGVSAAVTVMSRSQGLVDDTLDDIVRIRTVASGQIFTRRLHEDWTDLQFLAAIAGARDLERLSGTMEGMQGDGERLSWIGFADTEGRVVEATQGMLVGADVSARPWFTNGLRGDFGGDVHDAVLLASLLQPDGDQPLRFIDLALPVRNPEGDVIGVMAMHINADWVRHTLRETGELLELDLFLMNTAGTVVAGPGDEAPDLAGLQVLAAARTGSLSSGREVWPDGHAYFTALVPSLGYSALPSFGWRLAGRIDPEVFRPGYAALQSTALVAGGVALVLLAALTFLFVRVFVQPISTLGRQASLIARGEDVFPQENSSTLEAERLSRAFATLQGRAPTPLRSPAPRNDGTDPE